MKKRMIVEIIAALFIIFFVHSAITSLIRMESQKNLLAFYTYSKTEVAWAILLLESLIALLLVLPRTRTIGFLMSVLFMLCLEITIRMTPHYPHDFEGILNNMTRKQQLGLVIVSLVLALIAILLSIKTPKKTRHLAEVPIVYT